MWLQKRENFDTHTVVRGLFILANLKFESGNTVKLTKSNLKEEELEQSFVDVLQNRSS